MQPQPQRNLQRLHRVSVILHWGRLKHKQVHPKLIDWVARSRAFVMSKRLRDFMDSSAKDEFVERRENFGRATIALACSYSLFLVSNNAMKPNICPTC